MRNNSFKNEDGLYEKIKPVGGEKRFIEYDSVFQQWGIFGEVSGFCFASFINKEEADDYLNPNPQCVRTF